MGRKKTIIAGMVILTMLTNALWLNHEAQGSELEEMLVEEDVVYKNEAELWLNENQEFEYPITSDNEIWCEMTYQERLMACELPKEYLETITTEQLLDLALDYPFNLDFLFFDDYSRCIERYKNTSNIFSTLLSREDVVDVVVDKYLSLEVDYEILNNQLWSEKDTRFEMSGYDSELLLSVLLSYDEIMEKIDEEDAVLISQEAHQKYSDKVDVCQNFVTSYILFETVEENKNVNMEFARVMEENIVTASTSGFTADGGTDKRNGAIFLTGTYTKYGKTAQCLKYSSGDITNTERQEMVSYIMETYPDWIISYTATTKFNCHSYCWIDKMYTSVYWLDSPEAYAAASTYFASYGANTKITEQNSYIIINDRYGPAHSVRTLDSSSGISSGMSTVGWLTTARCSSKLGAGPVVISTVYDMYLFYNGVYYRVYTEK